MWIVVGVNVLCIAWECQELEPLIIINYFKPGTNNISDNYGGGAYNFDLSKI